MKRFVSCLCMLVAGGLLGHLIKKSPKMVHDPGGSEFLVTREGDRSDRSRDLLRNHLTAWPDMKTGLEFEAHWKEFQALAPRPGEVLKRLLAAQWVVEDGPSAIAFALTLQGEDRRFFLAEILERDAKLGLAHLSEMALHEGWISRTAQTWLVNASEGDSEKMLRLVQEHKLGTINPSLAAFAHPHRALAEAEEIDDPKERGKAISAICMAWYEREPEAAWIYARDHLPPRSWSGVSYQMFDNWMRRDARAAFPHRNDLSMVDTDPTYWYERLGSHWPKASIDELLRVTREVPPGESRSIFVAGLAYLPKQPETVDGCLDLLQLVPNEANARSALLQRIKELQVEAHGVDAAKEWAQTIPDSVERQSVMRSLPNYEPDLEETMSLLQEGKDGLGPAELIRDVVKSPNVTLSQLDEWLGRLPDALREDGLETVLTTLSPSDALYYVDRFLGDGPNWESKRLEAIRRGFDAEKGDRSKWLDAVLDTDADNSNLDQLLTRWIKKDPLAAEAWTKRQDHLAVEEAFVSYQLEARLKQPKQDWTALLEKAGELQSPRAMRAKIYRQWARADPEAALGALDQFDDVRQRDRICTEAEQHRSLVEAIGSLGTN